MARRRPYDGLDHVRKLAWQVWDGLSREDCVEAFRAHPRVGERARHASGRGESPVLEGGDGVLEILAKANRVYEARFGFPFLTEAGTTAQEVLDTLRRRLGNDPENEMRAAAEEQLAVIDARLRRLFAPA